MKNLLIAINNRKIYDELLKQKNINIINKNILYREGIIEILENNFEIDFIILNEKIPGEIELNNLIYKIKEINNNIKIILIIEKNKKDNIKNKNNLIILEEENIIQILNIIENKKQEKIEETKNENKKTEKTNKSIFLIDGNSGSGKSIISTILSYKISKENKKVLLVDFDIKYGNIHTILQVKKDENKIQKINKNLFFVNTNKEEIIEKLFIKNYDIVILDNYTKDLKINYKKIYLLESNLIEIEKLKSNINKKNYSQENIFFIINKYNKNCIDEKILEKIFETKNIFKIKYKSIYNSLINNFKLNKDNISLKNEYKNIIKKII